MARRSKLHAKMVAAFRERHPLIILKEEYYLGLGLSLDICLPNFSIGVEVDGEQHSTYTPFFHSDESDFNKQVMLDGKKNVLCIEKGIFLYRVNFDDKRNPRAIVDDVFDKAVKHFDGRVHEHIEAEMNPVCSRCHETKSYHGSDLCLFCIREEKNNERNDDSKFRRRFRAYKPRTGT